MELYVSVFVSGGWFFLLCLLELYDYAAFQWLSLVVCVLVLLSIFVSFVVVFVVQRPYLIRIAHFVRSPECICICVCMQCMVEGRRNKIDYNGTSWRHSIRTHAHTPTHADRQHQHTHLSMHMQHTREPTHGNDCVARYLSKCVYTTYRLKLIVNECCVYGRLVTHSHAHARWRQWRHSNRKTTMIMF